MNKGCDHMGSGVEVNILQSEAKPITHLTTSACPNILKSGVVFTEEARK